MFSNSYVTSCDHARKLSAEIMIESLSRLVTNLPCLLVFGFIGEEIESS